MSIIKFECAKNILDKFIELLDRYDITPAIGSEIEGELLSPFQLLEATCDLDSISFSPNLLADAAGIYDLAAKLLAVETQQEFKKFIPHLELFKVKSEFASVVQSKSASILDDTNRKIIELYLGSLAVHFGHNIRLDHPTNSKGDNPDIIFDIEPTCGYPPSTWAFAIKTTSSTSGQTIFENIQKAANQIDAASCPANHGMVIINLKNSLRHEDLWNCKFTSLEDAKKALQSQVNGLIVATEKDRSTSDWELLFSKRTSPIVLYLALAVVRLAPSGELELPTILRVCAAANPLSRADPLAVSIACQLNHWMQSISQGRPGEFGQMPA